MKKFIFSLLAIGLTILSGCSNNMIQQEEENMLTGIEEPMEISDTDLTVSNDGGTVTFEVTNYDSWFFTGATIQSGEETTPETIYPKRNQNLTNILKGDWYTIEVPENDKNKLNCTLSKNDNKIKRIIKIDMSVGDAYQQLTVTQE